MSDLARFAKLVRAAQRGVAFTGAGISTESGIPDFRGPQGVWNSWPAARRAFARGSVAHACSAAASTHDPTTGTSR